MKRLIITALTVVAAITCSAAVTIRDCQGWLETCWVEWHSDNAYNAYNVYVAPAGTASWTKLDNELVRNYGTYGRADALGLKAGSYQMKVVPVKNGSEDDSAAGITSVLTVKPHDRNGYAHFGRPQSGLYEGVGAYKNDGTLKDDAIVLYVTARNAKTISVTWPYTATSQKTFTGLYGIIEGFRKCHYMGGLKRPLSVRIIGKIEKGDMDNLRWGQGLDIKGEADFSELPLTFEGVGNDACIRDFGIQVSQATGVELRNFGVILCYDDAIELNKHNSHCWIHNIDLFYGNTGSDADQVKGDGAIDIKYSYNCTVAYNHFFDNGKCCLIDPSKGPVSSSEIAGDRLTYHHNWFDHADSRLPRCRHGRAFHVYNNYYDGNGSYGIGLASNAIVFAECNYFRNCQYPVINSAQGSDLEHIRDTKAQTGQTIKGTLSGEDGGVCKFWNNHVEGAKSLYTQNNKKGDLDIDAYEVGSRDEKVPATVKNLKVSLFPTATTYSNFDTDPTQFYDLTPDDPEQIPAIVTGQYGAGRCQKGDFSWTFDNETEDKNTELITELKSALRSYTGKLVGFYDGSSTGIATVTSGSSSKPAVFYDLLGRKVGKNYRGFVKKAK